MILTSSYFKTLTRDSNTERPALRSGSFVPTELHCNQASVVLAGEQAHFSVLFARVSW